MRIGHPRNLLPDPKVLKKSFYGYVGLSLALGVGWAASLDAALFKVTYSSFRERRV
jgi:hypothetical protein